MPTKFQSEQTDKRVVCLHIPDDYEYMRPDLAEPCQAAIPLYLA